MGEADRAVDGHRLRLLPGGPERLDALVALIDGAATSLRLLYYIWADDAAGGRVRDALVRAAARGVPVRLILDGFGSPLPDDYFDALKDAGGDVCRFLPRYGRRYLLRNHQKLALADADGERPRVIVGGFNVEDDYFEDGADAWRDLGLLIEGDAAVRIGRYFDELFAWTHAERPLIRDLRHIIHRWSEPRAGAVRWLFGGPTRRLSPWGAALRRDLDRARDVAMVAGYFTPGPRMMRRIERVAGRGRARVVTPAKVDHAAAIAAARHTYARLLRRGVRIWEYQPRKLHTKLYVLDDVVYIGSANFDVRSLYINLELMVRVEDARFADDLRGYFEGELAQAREVTAAEHGRAGWLDRLRWGVAYFVMGVLDVRVTRGLNFGVEDQAP